MERAISADRFISLFTNSALYGNDVELVSIYIDRELILSYDPTIGNIINVEAMSDKYKNRYLILSYFYIRRIRYGNEVIMSFVEAYPASDYLIDTKITLKDIFWKDNIITISSATPIRLDAKYTDVDITALRYLYRDSEVESLVVDNGCVRFNFKDE